MNAWTAADPPAPNPLLTHLRTGAWLDEQNFPPLRWVVPDVIPEGMSLLIGGPKIGKSWLSLSIGLAVASGGRVLGRIDVGKPRRVLLLALEDGDRRLQDRARKLLHGDRIPGRLDYMTRIEPGMVVPTIEAWLSTIGDSGEDPLVILDTLGKVMPPATPGESSYQRDYRVAGRLKRICDDHPGMALLVLHHDRKAQSDDFVDGVSGTNGIAGAADTIMVIARPRTEERGLIKITGRDVSENEYAVRVEGGYWSIVGDDLATSAAEAQTIRATANLGDRSAEIVRLAAKRPEGVRAADVAGALDVPSDEAGVYLRRLAEAGKLHKVERGLYGSVLSVLSVRSDEDATPEQNTKNTSNTTCSECEYPLATVLSASGETMHPTCGAAHA